MGFAFASWFVLLLWNRTGITTKPNHPSNARSPWVTVMSGIVSPECLSVVWDEGGDTRQRRVRFAEERVMICYKVETPLFCECVCALNDTGWRSRAGGNFQSLICPASRGVRALTNCFPFVSRPGLIDSVDVRLVPCSSSSSNLLVLFCSLRVLRTQPAVVARFGGGKINYFCSFNRMSFGIN